MNSLQFKVEEELKLLMTIVFYYPLEILDIENKLKI